MTSIGDRLSPHLADRYRIERELGSGGMATVYLAEDVRHHRKVAIKLLHPELSAVLGSERFLKEIELTASLQHPSILPLFDSGSADGLLYYVMPYVEGETLRGRIERERQLPIADAARIATDVSDALEYAHKRGVIHRDIKPENILLHGGRPLVADFGIALALQQAGGARMTKTGMSLGTPQYMAPEQAMGDRNVDHRADIYALGAVTYEMIAGEPPFTGPTSQAILAKVITTDPVPLVEKRRSVPPHIDAAVLTALEKTPADRFATAAEFSQALGSPTYTRTTISRPFAAALVRRPLLRDPRTWITIAAVAVAAVLLAMRIGSGRTSEAAGPTMAALLPPPGESWRPSGSTIALSPDGRKFVALDLLAGVKGTLVLRSMDSLGTVRLRGTEGANYPFWSPDGSSLGFFAGGQLRRLDLTSGGIRTLCAAPDPDGGSWGTDGIILYAPANRTSLHVVPAAGGECRALDLKWTGGPVSGRPYFLPDGQHFIVTTDRVVWLGSLGEHSVAKLVDTFVTEGVFAPPDYLLTKSQEGDLYAQRIDVGRRQMSGSATLVFDQVASPGGRLTVTASASGTLVAAGAGNGRRFLAFMTRGSGAVDSLPLVPEAWNFRFSHDGGRLAVAGWGLWIMDMERRVFSRVPAELDTGRVVVQSPVWAPGDSLVAFSRAYRDPGFTLFDPRSERASRWFEEPRPGRSATMSDWSPDGQDILVELGRGSDAPYSEIWIQDIQAKTIKPLISERGDVGDVRFSPSGGWVAYRSNVDGEDQIYLRPFPGPGTAIRVSPNGGKFPRWRGDGRELFYATPAGVIMAVGVRPDGGLGAPVSVTSGVPITARGIRSFEPTPDGQRFVFSIYSGDIGALTLVLDWWKLLERKR